MGVHILQLARQEERGSLLERTHSQTQEELSLRVQEVVKLEQIERKLNTEVKASLTSNWEPENLNFDSSSVRPNSEI